MFWFKKTPQPNSVALPEPEDKVILHGHDLSKWNYLGYSECSYMNEKGETTSSYPIFMFVDKKNFSRRSYHISGANTEYVEKAHQYVNKWLKPWAAGEYQFYELIKGEHAAPSQYLKNWMLEEYKCEWDSSTHWWGTSDKAKYTAAKNKQKREQKPKDEKPASNVVSVDFGKQG